MRFFRLQSTVLVFSLLAVFVLLGGSCTGWSQSTSGDIVGTVLDKSGAAIAGASVTATNVDTGVAVTVEAGKDGDFRLSNLLPGKYNISGTANGFATFTLTNFQVQLNKTGTAKLILPIATATASVEVTSEASAVLDTTTTQLQSSFETQELVNFPVASISGTTNLGVLNLALLVPGVSSSGALGAGTGPSVGGMRPTANNYTIEGIDNNNKSVTGPLIYVPSDAVAEFTVITNQFSPEFGHSAGGQFNSTIVSGTNKIHGEVYEFMVNRNLNAINAIMGGKTSNPRYDNNRYGGQIGGPIKKDKLFYFANYERQTNGQSAQSYLCTPTATGISMLSGISGLNATNLGIFTKYTPVSTSQVNSASDVACNNSTTDADTNPTGLQYLSIYPGTDLNGNGTSYSSNPVYGSGTPVNIPLGNYELSSPNYTNNDALTTSIDWTISSKDSFRGRYIYNKTGQIDTYAQLPAFYVVTPYRFHVIALSEYHTFSPNLINEARLGYNRFFNDTPEGNFSYPGLDSFPNLTQDDAGGLNIGPDPNAPQSTVQNLYQFTDNVSWVKGRHTFKFGFEGRKFISPQSFTQRVRGDYDYKYLTEYLHDLAPTNFGERSTGNFFYYGDQTAFYGYANDIWRVTDKISLNYGLRYEFTSVPVGERTQTLNSAASETGLIVFSEPKPQYKNFAPRVGINYELDSNTSIRGGFGMAYDVLFDNLGILSFPPQYSSTNDVGSGNNKNAGEANFLTDGGLPAGTGTLASFGTTADQRAATSAYVPNQKLPYAENWTLGIQHVFAKDYTVEARYVGTHGVHLATQVHLNVQPRVTAANQLPTFMTTPTLGDLTALTTNTLDTINPNNDGNGNDLNILEAYRTAGFTSKITSFQPKSSSNYHGLALSLKRRFSGGLLLDLAYTWSKTMDDATAATFSTVFSPRRPQNSQDVKADYSRSGLDHTHRISLAVVYDLPFFKNSSSLLKNTVGNWEIAPIYTYESPEYFTVLSGVNSNQNGDSSAIDRTIFNAKGVAHTGSDVTAYANPNLASLCGTVSADSVYDPNDTVLCNADLVAYAADNPNARYITAGAGTLPTASRNTEPIRPIDSIDATAIKRFKFTERYVLEFQAQGFNVLNHAQYTPGTLNNISSPQYTDQILYQTASNAGFNQPGKFFKANARTMQLALKFSF